MYQAAVEDLDVYGRRLAVVGKSFFEMYTVTLEAIASTYEGRA
jgi:hypothetical protein